MRVDPRLLTTLAGPRLSVEVGKYLMEVIQSMAVHTDDGGLRVIEGQEACINFLLGIYSAVEVRKRIYARMSAEVWGAGAAVVEHAKAAAVAVAAEVVAEAQITE